MNTTTAIRRAAFLFAVLVIATLTQAAEVRVYVNFAPGQKAAAHAALAQAQGRAHHDFDNLGAIAVSLPEQARDALLHNPAVASIEDDPVRGFLAQTVPYGITMVQAPAAVDAGATGAGIKIGVIDSGVYIGHEDFYNVPITGEPDFGNGDQRTWYRDVLSHGTHVVGTLAAANNGLGVIGVSPGSVSIHMVKVFGDTGNWIYSSDLLAAARAAAAKGVKIISMSLGGSGASSTENNGLAALYNTNGILLVAAAGNGGNTAVSYPAGYATVISVAAINSAKTVASFSQRNSDVELAAPGVRVLSTVSYGSGYDEFDGTSMATPHVAGVAALIWSKYPTATNAQVRQALVTSAQDLGAAGRDSSYGYGLVRASDALNALAALVGGGGGGGGGGTGDVTAPAISGVAAKQSNGKSGSFEITWTTDEPATSDVSLNGTSYPDSTLTTNHKRTFKGNRGTIYTYFVTSADAAGNSATKGPATITIQ